MHYLLHAMYTTLLVSWTHLFDSTAHATPTVMYSTVQSDTHSAARSYTLTHNLIVVQMSTLHCRNGRGQLSLTILVLIITLQQVLVRP